MPRSTSQDPSVAELLAWMREIPTPSWANVVRSVEYAVAELKDEALQARRRRSRKSSEPRLAGD